MSPCNNNEQSRLDLYNSKRWLLLIGGFAKSDGLIYILYRIWQYTVLFYIIAMSFCAAYFISPDKAMIIDASHVAMITIFATVGLSIRLITERSLNSANMMINNGIFLYEEEDSDVREVKLRNGIAGEIRMKSNLFFILFLSGSVSNLTLFPLSQIQFFTEDDNNDILNPYLPPYFFYMPFGTRTFLGYLTAYILNIVLVVTVYGIDLCMVEFYIRYTVQLKVHLQILNNSINNIQKRAVSMYLKSRRNILIGELGVDLFEQTEFQNCLNSCLKSNIMHHHALLRFKKCFRPFNDACLLDTFVMASAIYAAVLYLVLQKLPINYLVNFILLFLAEQTYLFSICLFGEEIIEESSKTFITLYNTPWFHCNKSFNKALAIMMSNTLMPVSLKAMLMDGAASVETYGKLMSAMYKIVNLWRQSDKAH